MNNKLLEKSISTAILLFGGAAMIFARRYHNSDPEAGIGIAGWIMFIIIFMWV
jgi:hypothetical protein